jgi:1-acyl-sn-glycerol-3-phosphate acyltransferase
MHFLLYQSVRRLLGLALGFYFRRIERFHPERIPLTGPVLFVQNHPGSLADSFVIGECAGRKVNFVATVQLFRMAPLKWLLLRCGVIPINRVKDDPRAMRSVAATFEACHRVLESGEAVAIFPEGVTYDDSQLKEVKSGAARIALDLEHKHGGKLGLKLLPIGLTYSAKERYRSDALVNIGEPMLVAPFLEGYEERRKESIQRLTDAIESRIRALILDTPQAARAELVAGITRLYLDRPRTEGGTSPGTGINPGNRIIDRELSPSEILTLQQRIASTVNVVSENEPVRAERFHAKLRWYERWVQRLHMAESEWALAPNRKGFLGKSIIRMLGAVLGAPLALYGWLHRLIPYAVVRWSAEHMTEPGKRKAQSATSSIIAGTVAFGVFYGLCILGVHIWLGWPVSLWYGLSLPVASLFAHYYLRACQRWVEGLRTAWLLARAPKLRERLVRCRSELIAEIEAVHAGEVSTGGGFTA